MQRKYGLIFDLQTNENDIADKHPYDNLLLATKPTDIDQDLLIFDTKDQCEEAFAYIDHMRKAIVPIERIDLLQLSKPYSLFRTFSDFGCTTSAGNSYLYVDLVYIFYFLSKSNIHEQQAVWQMEEYVLATCTSDDIFYYAVELHHKPLMHRIAEAYGCEIVSKS